MGGDRRRRGARHRHSAVFTRSDPSSSRRSTKGRSSTCRRRYLGSRSARPGKLLQVATGRSTVPEVNRVLGKAGRADTSTDPAPLSMLETVITLKPTSEWRRVDTWSPMAPERMKPVLRHVTPDHISEDQLIEEMNAALSYPGVSNAWTMPIKARVDMLTTGIRTPAGRAEGLGRRFRPRSRRLARPSRLSSRR